MAMTLILDCIEYGAGSCRNEDMIIELQARAEAAEQKLREIAQFTLKTNTRAEAAEAECERLREQIAALARQSASHDFLSDAKGEIWELFVAVRDDFDGSEYQQGKKDGLRSALALLGTPEMIAFNREGGMANAANSSQDAR